MAGVALFFFALFLCCIYCGLPETNPHSILKPSVYGPKGTYFGQNLDIWRETNTTSFAFVGANLINISHVYKFVEVPGENNLTVVLFQTFTQHIPQKNYGQIGAFSGNGTLIICGDLICEVFKRNSSDFWSLVKSIYVNSTVREIAADNFTDIAVVTTRNDFGSAYAYVLDLSQSTNQIKDLNVSLKWDANDGNPIKISNGTIYIGDYAFENDNNKTGRVIILEQTSAWEWTKVKYLTSDHLNRYGSSLGVFNAGEILAITGYNKTTLDSSSTLELYRDMSNIHTRNNTAIKNIGILNDALIISESQDLTCLRTGGYNWADAPYGLITAINIPRKNISDISEWGKTFTSSSSIYLVGAPSDRLNFTGVMSQWNGSYDSSLEGSGPFGAVYVYYCSECPFCDCRSANLFADQEKVWPDYLAQCDCGIIHEDTVVIPEDVIITEPFTTVEAPDGHGNLTIGGQLNVTIGGKLTIGNNSVVNVKNETVISGNLSLVVDLKSFNSMKETVNDTTTVYTVNVLKSGGDITYDENKVKIQVINSEDLGECETLESKTLETSSDKRSLNVLMTVRTKEGCGGAAADSNSDGISGGAIAGIVIGIFAGLVIVIAVLVIVIIALKVYRQKHLFKA